MSELSPLHSDVGPAERRAFVVLGMHRSGTSAMAKTLALLGAKLPKHLMPATESNPAGHWEPQNVANLNDEILQALDSEWDDVFASRPREYLSNFDRYYLGRAVELVQDDFNGSELIVLKDPRIAVLTPFWDRALREAGYTTHYIIMVRNPLEVAESLRARDSFPREKSLLLWSSYMIAADRDTRDKDRIFVSYDQLLTDWRGVRNRIERSAGIPFPRNTTTAANEIDRHLDDRLRHHRAAAEDVVSRSDVPEEVQILYRIFLGACEGAEIDRSKVDEIHAELSKMDSFVGPLLADYRSRVRTLAQDMAELGDAHAGARDRANALEEQLTAERELRQADAQASSQSEAEYEQRLTELAEQLEAMQARTANEIELTSAAREVARAEVESLRADVLRMDELVERLRRENGRLDDELSSERTAHSRKRQESERQSAEIFEARQRLGHLEEKLTQERELRTTERERAREETAALHSRVEQNHSQLSLLVERLREREVDLAARQVEMDTVRNGLAAANDELANAKQELSKVTRTLGERERAVRHKDAHLEWLRLVDEEVLHSTRGWRSFLPPRLRRRLQFAALRERGLFDSEAYLERNEDVAKAKADPLLHFIMYGMKEGRDGGVKIN